MTCSGDARRHNRCSMGRANSSARGSVAVEFAVAIPAVAAVCALAVSAVMAASAQVAAQDIAGEAARLVARGDDFAPAIPAGVHAEISIADHGDMRCASASIPVRLLGAETGIVASARSCALRDADRSEAIA